MDTIEAIGLMVETLTLRGVDRYVITAATDRVFDMIFDLAVQRARLEAANQRTKHRNAAKDLINRTASPL